MLSSFWRPLSAILLFLFLPVHLSGFDLFEGWDTTDKTFYAASATALIADAWTTTVAMRDENSRECNRILGDHPSNEKIVTFTAANIVLKYLIADYLPPAWRKVFLSGSFILNATYASRNYIEFKEGF